jgi:anti-sigma factor ChrR (cupin superfamily)
MPRTVKSPESFVFIGRELAARADSLPWQPFRPGVERHILYGSDGADAPMAALLRYAPGAHVPPHEHVDHEHIFVLAGAQEDERGRYEAGTAVINPPGSRHNVKSDEGCLVLAVWNRPVRFT